MKKNLLLLLILAVCLTGCSKAEDPRGYGFYQLLDMDDSKAETAIEKVTGHDVDASYLGDSEFSPKLYRSTVVLEEEELSVEIYTAPEGGDLSAGHPFVYEVLLSWKSKEKPTDEQMDHFAAIYHRLVEDFGSPINVSQSSGGQLFKGQLERFGEENRGSISGITGFYALWPEIEYKTGSKLPRRYKGSYLIQYSLTHGSGYEGYSLLIHLNSSNYYTTMLEKLDQDASASTLSLNGRGAFGDPDIGGF